MASHPVFLLDKATGQPVDAELFEVIDESHLLCWEKEWMPLLLRRVVHLMDQGLPTPENWHWRWREKVMPKKGILAFKSFAIVCGGQTQGLMLVNTAAHSRLPGQANMEVAYIDYVETAPWNRSMITDQPRFGGVGTVMVRAAIELSHAENCQGRVGLHSLPQAEAFYSQACGMTDLGIDGTKENLRYFEMTPEQSAAFAS